MSTKPRAPRPWVPHRVLGKTTWEHAAELNVRALFDGGLLVPRIDNREPAGLDAPVTEGAPPRARWDVDGLMPIARAREEFPAETAQALAELQTAAHRFRTALEDPQFPLRHLADALVLPALGTRDEANYFFDHAQRRIRVANWGAAKPPALYAFEGDEFDDDDGDATRSLRDGEGLEDEKEIPDDEAPPTAEELAELEALADGIQTEMAETRGYMEILEAMMDEPPPAPPQAAK